jgi:hypothetical protein
MRTVDRKKINVTLERKARKTETNNNGSLIGT